MRLEAELILAGHLRYVFVTHEFVEVPLDHSHVLLLFVAFLGRAATTADRVLAVWDRLGDGPVLLMGGVLELRVLLELFLAAVA